MCGSYKIALYVVLLSAIDGEILLLPFMSTMLKMLEHGCLSVQGGPKSSLRLYQIIKKSHSIVLKLAIEIRLLRQIKVSIKYYDIIHWY